MHLNRLAEEKSPYLRQHAHNPVDWYPWGEEAFTRARQEQKPIFLSIGYSTCHWCHVMEHESFENEEIAALMNRWFISIKVDREERPDIDRIYMSYVQATSGGGGWPMSVWLTPDLKPFVGGTYFPPDNRYGRAGFPVVLERIAEAWQKDRARILESSTEVMEQLRLQAEKTSKGAGRVDGSVMDSAFRQFQRTWDPERGGFGGAPKFPRPSVHNFLLRYSKRTGNKEALDMVAATLLAMNRGGMNDQLGGGFHRYSVDEYWFVPHFEKMLYDQAQLAISFLETFQITREPEMERAVRGTLDYVLRDMTSPKGGFWSAEDADSAPDAAHPDQKSEGAFYIWQMAEIVSLLGEERAGRFAASFGVRPDGNVDNDPHGEFGGRNILYRARTGERDEEAERILFEARSRRPRPHLDDKILTSWNGLMISAFAKAGAVLNEARYVQAARDAAGFILERMRQPGGGLLRRYRDGEAAIAGMLDDYAFFVQALLDLYESTFEETYLTEALELTEVQSRLLEDPEGGGFFASAQADASSLMRMKDDYDGAEPSGNSIALMNLLRLHRATGLEKFEGSARRLISAFSARLEESPYAMPQMLCACEIDFAPHREVIVAGDPTGGMVRLLRAHFDPSAIVLHAGPELTRYRPEVAEMRAAPGQTAVYICTDFTCAAPARSEQELLPLLK